MTIQDGMRIHNEAGVPRYRMPDLLTREEMVLFFASTYGIGIEFTELSDELREKTTGVGVLPVTPPMTDRDRELSELRRVLGIEELEAQLNVAVNELSRARELDSRVMTREQFAEKYGEQPPVETPDEKDARLNPADEAKGSPDDSSDEVDGPLPTFEATGSEVREDDLNLPDTDSDRRENLDLPVEGERTESPSEELNRLLGNQKKDDNE